MFLDELSECFELGEKKRPSSFGFFFFIVQSDKVGCIPSIMVTKLAAWRRNLFYLFQDKSCMTSQTVILTI